MFHYFIYLFYVFFFSILFYLFYLIFPLFLFYFIHSLINYTTMTSTGVSVGVACACVANQKHSVPVNHPAHSGVVEVYSVVFLM